MYFPNIWFEFVKTVLLQSQQVILPTAPLKPIYVKQTLVNRLMAQRVEYLANGAEVGALHHLQVRRDSDFNVN